MCNILYIRLKTRYLDCLPGPYATSPPQDIPSGVPGTSGCWPDGQFDAVAENINITLNDPPFIERHFLFTTIRTKVLFV